MRPAVDRHSEHPLPSKFALRPIIFISLGILLATSLYFASDSHTYGKIAAGLLSSSLKPSGLELELVNPDLDGLSLLGDKLYFQIKDSAFSCQARETALRVALLPLLGGNFRGHLRSELEGGQLRASVDVQPGNDTAEYDASLWQVHLAENVFFQGFGVNSGILDMDLAGLKVVKGKIEAGNARLKVTNLGRSHKAVKIINKPIPGTHYMPGFVNLNLNLVAAKISDIDIAADISFQPHTIALRKLEVSLEFGTVEVSGQVDLSKKYQEIKLDVHGKLSEEGARRYGSVLGSFIYGSSQRKVDYFQGKLEGPLHSPRWKWKR
jgi:hypothetical protein